jgi:outer membrane immunogenic protein
MTVILSGCPMVRGAWANGTVTDDVTGARLSGNNAGVIGGGTIGYNWQFVPNWVVGVEGTFDVGVTWPVSVQLRQSSPNADWVATIAGRLGYAANNWLFYAKGGGGWTNNSATVTDTSQTGPAPGVLPTGLVGGSVTAGNTAGGWLAGDGIEYGLTPYWTLKAEYDYLGLGSMTVNCPLVVGDTINVSRNINMFTVGLNYRF